MAFDGARLKLRRAEKHIADLRCTFESFSAMHRHQVRVENDPAGAHRSLEVRFEDDLPSDLALILGDAIHNLRCVLDHATWELIGVEGGERGRYTRLPTADSKANYESQCAGMRNVSPRVIEFLVDLGAYDGGPGDWLYALHQLDIAEKHRVLTPIAGVLAIPNLTVLNEAGSVVATFQDCKLEMNEDGKARLMVLPPWTEIRIGDQPGPRIDIFFANVKPFAFQPIFPTLEYLRNTVEMTLSSFASVYERYA